MHFGTSKSHRSRNYPRDGALIVGESRKTEPLVHDWAADVFSVGPGHFVSAHTPKTPSLLRRRALTRSGAPLFPSNF